MDLIGVFSALYICGRASDLSFCIFDDEGVWGEGDGRDTFNVRGWRYFCGGAVENGYDDMRVWWLGSAK